MLMNLDSASPHLYQYYKYVYSRPYRIAVFIDILTAMRAPAAVDHWAFISVS